MNHNALTTGSYQKAISNAITTGDISLGGVFQGLPGGVDSTNVTTVFYALLLSQKYGELTRYEGEPMSFFVYPIFESHKRERVVAAMGAVVNWKSYFQGVVPPESPPVTVVLENECDGAFTFMVDNERVTFKGDGDLHNTMYDHMERRARLNSLYSTQKASHKLDLDELCPFELRVYPTREMEEANETRIPFITTLSVGLVFLFTAAVFVVYNRLVERRQTIVLTQATQSTEIVASFLPDAVQRRLLGDGNEVDAKGEYSSPMKRLKTFLAEGDDNGQAKPIADLFPYTTVLFADVRTLGCWF